MKIFFTTLSITILFFSDAFAERLNTQSTLDKAIQQSVKKDKPIILIVSVPHINAQQTLNGTKINFNSAIDEAEVIEKINENFIAYKTLMSDTSIRSILSNLL